MKLAHAAIRTPGACGLYETTRELAAGLRSRGVDSRIVDPKPNPKFAPVPQEDRGVPIADMRWGVQSDLVVSHSGHDGTPLDDCGKPIIHVQHGRPVSSWLLERSGSAPSYSYAVERKGNPRYRACVTFWPEYQPMLQQLWGDVPVFVVQPSCDLERWSDPLQDVEYDFMGRTGEYNVVMTDPWSRPDVSGLTVVHAFKAFAEAVPGAKLHIYGIDNERGFRALKATLGDNCGLLQGWAKDLHQVYSAADMLITPHRIYTRSIREAMAMNIQVVSGRDAHPEDTLLFAAAMVERMHNPTPTRKFAEALFDPEQTAAGFSRVLEAVM